MNTSIPSTSSDLATLVGAAPQSCAQLKGMMGGLKGKSATSDDHAATGSDFASLLDSPAGDSDAALSGSAGHTCGDDSAATDGNRRRIFSVEINPVASATLQIKGMVSELVPVCTSSAASLVNAEPTVAVEPVATTAEVPVDVVQDNTPGRHSRVGDHAKTRPGLGQFLRSCGRQASESIHSIFNRTSDKPSGLPHRAPVSTDTELSAELNVASCNIDLLQAALAAGQGMQGAVLPVEPMVVPAALPVSASGDSAEGATPVVGAPATGLFNHAVHNRPFGKLFAHRSENLPAVENHLESGETEAAEIAFRQSIPLSLKREIIESISAVLAPLMVNVLSGAAIMPDSSAASVGTGSETEKSTASKAALSATVTVRLGSQPPFRIELPLPVSLLSEMRDLVTDPSAVGNEASVPALEPTSVGQTPLSSTVVVDPAPITEALSVDVREVPPVWTGLGTDFAGKLPLDLPLQLKATINTAWDQAQPAGQTEQSELLAFIGEQVAALKNPPLGNEPAVKVTATDAEKADPAETPVTLMIKVPGLGSIVAQVMTSNPAANAFAQKISVRSAGMEAKTAGEIRAERGEKKGDETIGERIFLNTGNQMLKAKANDAGIGVAKLDDTMPAQFTSRRVAVEQLELPSRITARDFLPAGFGSPVAAAPAEAPAVSTPAPVLAHRAVETIFNVVEAQRNGLSNATSVNLHFKFGGDDLAVRVQMRGGEVQTQFLTDSSDLRAALASEWQTLAGQGGVSGLKLLDPVIMPASANVSTGFGSASQGQGQAQQQAQQQHQAERAPAAFPELRALRRNLTPVAEPASPAATAERANAQHLAALA